MSVTSTMAHALCHRAFASCSRLISVSFSLLLPTCFPHSKFSFFCTSANTPDFFGVSLTGLTKFNLILCFSALTPYILFHYSNSPNIAL